MPHRTNGGCVVRREKRKAENEQRYFADRERLREKRQRKNSPVTPVMTADPRGSEMGSDGEHPEGMKASTSDSRDDIQFAAVDARSKSGGGVKSARRHVAAGYFF